MEEIAMDLIEFFLKDNIFIVDDADCFLGFDPVDLLSIESKGRGWSTILSIFDPVMSLQYIAWSTAWSTEWDLFLEEMKDPLFRSRDTYSSTKATNFWIPYLPPRQHFLPGVAKRRPKPQV